MLVEHCMSETIKELQKHWCLALTNSKNKEFKKILLGWNENNKTFDLDSA